MLLLLPQFRVLCSVCLLSGFLAPGFLKLRHTFFLYSFRKGDNLPNASTRRYFLVIK